LLAIFALYESPHPVPQPECVDPSLGDRRVFTHPYMDTARFARLILM
jgi:hypothetical protein